MVRRPGIRDIEISDNEKDIEERKREVRKEDKPETKMIDEDPNPTFLMNPLSDDIRHFKTSTIINKARIVKSENPEVEALIELIMIIKFNNYHTIEIDQKEYYVMSDLGLQKLKAFEFSNIK